MPETLGFFINLRSAVSVGTSPLHPRILRHPLHTFALSASTSSLRSCGSRNPPFIYDSAFVGLSPCFRRDDDEAVQVPTETAELSHRYDFLITSFPQHPSPSNSSFLRKQESTFHIRLSLCRPGSLLSQG